MNSFRIATSNGELNAEISCVEPDEGYGSFAVILESKNGQGRNPDYYAALDEILTTLKAAACRVLDVEIASKRAEAIAREDRVLPIAWPVDMSSVSDPQSLRKMICSAQTKVVTDANKGGNSHRRIKINVDAPSPVTIGRFRTSLLSPTDEFRPASTLSPMAVIEKELAERETQLDEHERQILDRTVDGPVEKLQLVKSRRGQGVFKKNVLDRESSCRVFGITEQFVLRASHIKPWAVSTDAEKIDGNNGLMLSPHVDVLFDIGMISFTKSGDILVSPRLPHSLLSAWNINPGLNVGSFSDQQDQYLEFHRTNVFK